LPYHRTVKRATMQTSGQSRGADREKKGRVQTRGRTSPAGSKKAGGAREYYHKPNSSPRGSGGVERNDAWRRRAGVPEGATIPRRSSLASGGKGTWGCRRRRRTKLRTRRKTFPRTIRLLSEGGTMGLDCDAADTVPKGGAGRIRGPGVAS